LKGDSGASRFLLAEENIFDAEIQSFKEAVKPKQHQHTVGENGRI